MTKRWRITVAAVALAALAALGACKGSSGADWSTKEIKPVEASLGDVPFSIALPDGLKKNGTLSSDTLLAWEAAEGGSLTVAVAKLSMPPATLKDAVARSGGDMVVAKQEAIDGGFLVTSHNNAKDALKVDVYKLVGGGGALWCNATQSGAIAEAKLEAAKAWLEKVCLSVDPKGAPKGAAQDGKDAKAAPSVDLLPEMREFLGELGSSAKVTAALAKHGAEGLDTKDMGRYDLTAPKVLKAELHGVKLCYALEAKAGEATRAYLVCWDGGKIVSIEDMGVR